MLVRRLAAVALALVLAGCASAPNASPTTSVITSSQPTANPTTTVVEASPASPPSDPPQPTPEPGPTDPRTAWDQVASLDHATVSDLIAAPDGFIAAGCARDPQDDDGICFQPFTLHSSDGTTWERFDVGVPIDLFLTSLSLVGDRLFAIAYGHYDEDGGAIVLTSGDGRTWSRVESSSFRGRAIDSIVHSPSGAIAAGYEAPIDSDDTSGFVVWAVHADGSFGEPTVVDVEDGQILGSAAWTGTEFLAWTWPRWNPGPVTVLGSEDGSAWEVRGQIRGDGGANVGKIVTWEKLLIAVGSEGSRYPLTPRAWTSGDGGRTWTRAKVAGEDAVMLTVARSDSGLVARGSRAYGVDARPLSWTSADGSAWALLPDDEDLPAITGFAATGPVSIGDRTCVGGTLVHEHAPRALVYCRSE